MKIMANYDKKTKLDKTMDIAVRKPLAKSKIKSYMKPGNNELNKS